jgi:predicted ATPase/DNA-binding CsgD family transcriptional regulator
MQLTSLLGREQEMTTLRQLLHRQGLRLITITGPAGVGKTSLSLAVAHAAQDAFADGVFYVSLAPISDPTLIIQTIAQTLSLPESPRRLGLDSLKEYLQNRQLLLLLDNFEQIITAAPLLTELLSTCHRLQLLVTSREALHVRGEQEFLLSPLALPDQPAFETLHQYPGIALFVQRAQAAQLDFRLTEQNAAAVAELCAHLDGLPLAIELAAARIKLFPPPAMLERLQESPMQLLRGGARDLPARQQTLRRAVQWSYDLLADEEQRAFRWLAVFVGGSTLEAALAVLESPISVDVLDSLVSKSLLRQIETNDAPRLVMLETIREFGWEQLTQTAELDAARRAHATYYASLAEEAEPHLVGADQKAWLQRLEIERDNLRAALQWAIEHHEGDLARRMAGALQPFWFARSHWSEGRRWLEESLAMDSIATPDQAVQAKVLYKAGVLVFYQGDYARARVLCEQSLALYRALDDKAGVLMALVQLGRIAGFQEDQKATKAFMAEAASLIDTLPDSVEKAGAYTNMFLASMAFDKGVFGGSPILPETARYLAESERLHRAFNNQAGLAVALTHQATQAFIEGDYTLAASRTDEAERLAMELDDDRVYNRVFVGQVLLEVHEGDFATARQRAEDILRKEDIHRQAGNRSDYDLSSGLTILAAILHRQGLAVWSARVYGLAEAWASTGQSTTMVSFLDQQFPLTRSLRARLRAELGDEAFAREIAVGRQLTLDDILAIPHPPADAKDSGAAKASGTFLTARENEVLHLLDHELSNLQIAERLVISRRTVDAHLRSIYDKLGVKSRDAATRVAREQGLLG